MSARPTETSVVRALHGAAWIRSGRTVGNRHASENHTYRPGPVGTPAHGLVVYMAAAFAPFAETYRAGRTTSHRPRAVYIAWRRGRPVGRLVVTWCGNRLVTATLTEDPGCAHQACQLCELRGDWPRRCCASPRGCCG